MNDLLILFVARVKHYDVKLVFIVDLFAFFVGQEIILGLVPAVGAGIEGKAVCLLLIAVGNVSHVVERGVSLAGEGVRITVLADLLHLYLFALAA